MTADRHEDSVLTGVTGCALSPRPDEARKARSFTRRTLASWGLSDLIDDAVVIVGELLANAVRHAGAGQPGHRGPGVSAPGAAMADPGAAGPGAAAAGASAVAGEACLGLWLLRHAAGLMCVVTDQSEHAPVLKQPGEVAEGGRGLHVIHSLSDHWGWSLLSGPGQHGKAVWAILFTE